MLGQFIHLKLLAKRLGIIFVFYFILRILFIAWNASLFPNLSLAEAISICLNGIRFDISAIFYVNALVILLHLIPIPYRKNSLYQKTIAGIFYLMNSLALAVIIIDFELFPYTLKRSDSGVFSYLSDFQKLFGSLVLDFWYVFIGACALIFFIIYLYRKTSPKNWPKQFSFIPQFILFATGIGLTVIGLRGGLQLRPITPITAAKTAGPEFMSLVSNTPFNVIHSISKKKLEKLTYYSPNELNERYPILKNYSSDSLSYSKPNIVFIILESCSKEYTKLGSGESYTPFLDSLMDKSLTFTNAFANGKQSNKAVPAICASIPVLMDDPFVASIYQQNRFSGLASLLRKEDYSTAFYHGANNGSFHFDDFAKAAGYQEFFGRNEYNNDDDFDGSWGIFDGPYFKYAANEMSKLKEPFHTSIFTLSAHHPFALPKGLENKFKKGTIAMHELVGYADFALKGFFEEAKKQAWYENTIFIITADHSGPVADEYQSKLHGIFAVPILWYHPDGRFNMQKHNGLFQQTDIIPSLLDYLHYPKPFKAFGNSVFEKHNEGLAFQYHNGIYQLINDEYVFHYDGQSAVGLYKFPEDRLLENNLIKEEKEQIDTFVSLWKAIIQRHNNTIIDNKLFVE